MRPISPTAPAPTQGNELMQSAAVALSAFFDGHPVPTFAIDANHVITHWNQACEQLLGWSREHMLGTSNHWRAVYNKPRPLLADLILDGDAAQIAVYYPGKSLPSTALPDAWEVEDFFPNIGASGQWLHLTAAPLRNGEGAVVGAIETLRDVTERRLAENALRRAHDNLEHLVEKRTAQLAEVNGRLEEDIRQRQLADAELRRRNLELTELNRQLSTAQQQLLQAEKLASIGQLAAGVAHEINNPIGYIFSNFGTLQTYLVQLFDMLGAYQQAESAIGEPAVAERLRAMRDTIDLDFLREDIPTLMSESKEGIVRVRHIVQDLKDFSRVDANQEWVWADLHQGIDSTLNIVSNEVKYKADVVKHYGQIPAIECLPLQINQVVMNLVVNAAHAIGSERGLITVSTGLDGDEVWIAVADTGSGIAPDTLSRIFDPFFTTKAVGKGTGLGLSLAYGIVQKHRGRIAVESEPGKGTLFRIHLPIRHSVDGDAGAPP